MHHALRFLNFLAKFGELHHQEFCKVLAINLHLGHRFQGMQRDELVGNCLVNGYLET
jgi:hypothetical protein